MNENNQVSYCLKCGKKVSNETKKCECGCKDFIFGKEGSFSRDSDGNIICNCGAKTWASSFHADAIKCATTNFACRKCGTVIGKAHYRSNEEMMYWE